jgi:hypothetical protein
MSEEDYICDDCILFEYNLYCPICNKQYIEED